MLEYVTPPSHEWAVLMCERSMRLVAKNAHGYMRKVGVISQSELGLNFYRSALGVSRALSELKEESWANGLAGVYGDGRHPSVVVLQKNVAAAGANCFEAEPFKNADDLFALEARETGHTEIC